jgi:ribosomal protein S18 acetylase RimI-like enzyme
MAKDKDDGLIEAARHRGLKLVRSRRRKPGTGDYGLYGLTDLATGRHVLGFDESVLTATADDISAFLRRGEQQSWATSLASTPEPKEPRTPEHNAPPAPQPKPRRERAPPRSRVRPQDVEPPPPILSVREADADDAPAIRKVIGPAMSLHQIKVGIAEGARTGEPVLVAVLGTLVGCASWHALPGLLQPVSGRVALLMVAEDYRRRGIGRALLEAAATRLADRGCVDIEVMSTIEVANANAFLRACGFREASYRFVRERPRTAS